MSIVNFTKENRWLSNFWPVKIVFPEGLITPSGLIFKEQQKFNHVEGAYQAFKAINKDDYIIIRDAATPGEAKRLGTKIPIVDNWTNINLSIMKTLIEKKFTYGTELELKLLRTGEEELIEGNHWHDQHWGSCYCSEHYDIPGENHLGKLLMNRREELRN